MFLPDKADDHLTGPKEEGEDVKKDVSNVTVEFAELRWDGINQKYIVKCVETDPDDTGNSNDNHKLIDQSCKGPVKHLSKEVFKNCIFIHNYRI